MRKGIPLRRKSVSILMSANRLRAQDAAERADPRLPSPTRLRPATPNASKVQILEKFDVGTGCEPGGELIVR